MHVGTQNARAVTKMVWVGLVLSGLMVLFLLFDGGIKIPQMAPAVEGTTGLGYASAWFNQAIPRMAILGAILLTGYLGGAAEKRARVEDPWLLFPVVLEMLIWTGLYLRDERLRTLIPLS